MRFKASTLSKVPVATSIIWVKVNVKVKGLTLICSQEVDICVAPLSISWARESVVDFTYPFYSDSSVVLYRLPDARDGGVCTLYSGIMRQNKIVLPWRRFSPDPCKPVVKLCLELSLQKNEYYYRFK